MKKLMVMAALAVMAAFAAHAVTRIWNPTVKADDGKYYWSNANNWLDENGNTGIPATGDTVVMANGSNVWGIQNPTLHALILRPTGNNYGLSGSGPKFGVGSAGVRLETARTVSYWLGLAAPANYDHPIYVCEGGTLTGTESYSGSGRFLKQGPGEFRLGNKSGGATRFNWSGTVIEAGTFGMGACDMELTNHEFVFAGPTARALLYSNQTLVNANFHETDGVVMGSHSIDASTAFQRVFKPRNNVVCPVNVHERVARGHFFENLSGAFLQGIGNADLQLVLNHFHTRPNIVKNGGEVSPCLQPRL